MSKARELLQRVIKNQYINDSDNKKLRAEIKELLAQPELSTDSLQLDAQEPATLSDLQIWTANSDPLFEDGVRFAESHYGITRETK